MRPIVKASTDQSVVIRILDSADGTPEQAVEHDSPGISLWYRREGGSVTAITPASLAAANSAHADGGIEHLDDGYYRLDLPDAAVASSAGVNGVTVGGAVTGMVVVGAYVPLVDTNPYDAVRGGMTALPNANAEAAGGLYTRGTGAGQINQPANGLVDVNVERWNATAVPAEHTAGYPVVTVKDGTGTGELDTASGRVLADTVYWNGTAVETPDVAGVANVNVNYVNGDPATTTSGSVDANVVSISGDSTAADNLEKEYDGTGWGKILVRTTIATLTNQTTFTLTAGSADNDAYNGCVLVVEDASTAAQKCVAVVADYVGSTKGVTLLNDPAVFTMATGDAVTVIADRALKATVDNRTLDVTSTGAAGIDWNNVENKTTTNALTGTTISVSQVVGSVSGGVGGDVGGNVVGNVQGDVLGHLVGNVQGNVVGDVQGDLAGAVGSLDTQAKADVNAEVDTALSDIQLDHWISSADPGSIVANNSLLAKLVSKSVTAAFADFVNTTDSLQALRDNHPANFASLGITAGGRALTQSAAVKNAALSAFPFVLRSSTDHVTPITGRTVTAQRSLDGAAFASCANSVTELSNGVYKIDLAASDLNADTVILRFTATGADPCLITITTQP